MLVKVNNGDDVNQKSSSGLFRHCVCGGQKGLATDRSTALKAAALGTMPPYEAEYEDEARLGGGNLGDENQSGRTWRVARDAPMAREAASL